MQHHKHKGGKVQSQVVAHNAIAITVSIMILFGSFAMLFAGMQIEQNNGRKIQMNEQRMSAQNTHNAIKSATEKREQGIFERYGAADGRIVNDAIDLRTEWSNSADLISMFPEYANQPNITIIDTVRDWASKLDRQNFEIAKAYRKHYRLSAQVAPMHSIPEPLSQETAQKLRKRGGKRQLRYRRKWGGLSFNLTVDDGDHIDGVIAYDYKRHNCSNRIDPNEQTSILQPRSQEIARKIKKRGGKGSLRKQNRDRVRQLRFQSAFVGDGEDYARYPQDVYCD